MRPRGRRHWTETIDVLTVTHVTSGPDTGAVTTTPLHERLQASVQPVSNAEAIQHGLDASRTLYWVRYSGAPPKLGDLVTWRGQRHEVVMVSEGEDVDTQLVIRVTAGGAS